MTLQNQNWLSFAGQPLGGRVPTRLTVYAPPGLDMNAQQRGGLLQQFNAFATAVQVSPHSTGYHSRHGKLSDGSPFRMIANNGVFEVQVWISGGGKPAEYRGYVVVPKFYGDNTPEVDWKNSLLRVDGASWEKWRTPYAPGKNAAVSYFVDIARSRKPQWLQEGDEFKDVFLWASNRIYKNGISYGTAPSNTGYALTVVRSGEAPDVNHLFAADEQKLYRVTPEALEPLFTFAPTYASGVVAASGPRLTPADVTFALLNSTSFGAVQIRGARLPLLPEPPWVGPVETLNDQVDVRTSLYAPGGWTSLVQTVPDKPIAPPVNSDAFVVGWVYPPAISGFSPFQSLLYATDLKCTNGTEDVNGYDKNVVGDGGDTYELMFGESVQLDRSVLINTRSVNRGGLTWSCLWPGPTTWDAASSPQIWEFGLYGMHTQPDLALDNVIYAGDPMRTAMTEVSGLLNHSDVGTSRVHLNSTSGHTAVLYQADTTHTLTHSEIETYEFLSRIPPASIVAGNPGALDELGNPVYTNWPAVVLADSLPVATPKRMQKNEGFTVSGQARDYILYDTTNNIYLYLKTVIDGSYSYAEQDFAGGAAVAGITVTFTLVLETPMGTFNGTSQTLVADGMNTNLSTPPEFNFGTINRIWKYCALPPVLPVLSPLWFDQGACPHIAYSVDDEPQERLLASFRLQFIFAGRPLFANPPFVPNTTAFTPAMGEQLAGHWLPGLPFFNLAPIESVPFILNASVPNGAPDPTVDFQDNLAPTHKSEFYRT